MVNTYVGVVGKDGKIVNSKRWTGHGLYVIGDWRKHVGCKVEFEVIQDKRFLSAGAVRRGGDGRQGLAKVKKVIGKGKAYGTYRC